MLPPYRTGGIPSWSPARGPSAQAEGLSVVWTPLFGGFGSGFGGETSVMFDLEGVLGLPASLLGSISTFSGRFGGGDGLVSAGLHAYAVFTTL